jgi:hypothetical protein
MPIAAKNPVTNNPIPDPPDYAQAEAKAHVSLANATAKLERVTEDYRALVDRAYGARTAEQAAEALFAQSELPAARLRLLQAQAEADRARLIQESATTSRKDAVYATYDVSYRAAILDLKAALLAAREANGRVLQIQDERHTATGRVFESFAWIELGGYADGSATSGERLYRWLQGIRAEGLDDLTK